MSAWDAKDFDDNIKKIAEQLPEVLEGMSVVCATTVKGSHRKRLDNGNPKKNYKSEAYKKIRSNKGRQTAYIDMQLSGEFVRSMKVGVEGGDVVYGVQNVSVGKTTTSTIYQGQIQRNGHGDLLSVNGTDAAKGIEASNRYFTDQVADLFAEV